VLRVAGLSKTYRGGRVRALDGLTFEARAGEALGIVGPNGAGKTTLMGCLLGLLRPDSGTIQFTEGDQNALAVRAATGYLPERLNFDRWMTGWAFVAYHHALARRPPSTRDAEVTAALESVGLQTDAWRSPVRRYSRGMLQRVGLAQAILGPPRYLLLDEPSSGVDPAGVLQIRAVLNDLKARGTTIVLNSHQLDQVEKLCDRVVLVRGGRVEAIDDLHSNQRGRRQVEVRWASVPPAGLAGASAVAASAGCELKTFEEQRGVFAASSEDAVAALVRGLTEAGFSVVGVASIEGRLERHFAGRDET
jgi:ABC-2 type transport system ATP-binding protein